MNISEQIAIIKQRLLQPLPGISAQELMAGRVLPTPTQIPDTAKISAVLCLLFPFLDQLHVLLMKRMIDKTAHSGQVSFPGGKQEQEDKDLQATALREAYEEVGIASGIEVLGELTPLYIPVSNFKVHPFVGFCSMRPVYIPNDQEVANVIEVPLPELFHQRTKTTADVISPVWPGVIRKVNAYVLQDGTVIWGATAMILSELEVLISTT